MWNFLYFGHFVPLAGMGRKSAQIKDNLITDNKLKNVFAQRTYVRSVVMAKSNKLLNSIDY